MKCNFASNIWTSCAARYHLTCRLLQHVTVNEVGERHEALSPAIGQVVAPHLHRHRPHASYLMQVRGPLPPLHRPPVRHAAYATIAGLKRLQSISNGSDEAQGESCNSAPGQPAIMCW